MESTSQTGLHTESRGRAVNTETTRRISHKTTSETIRETRNSNHGKQLQKRARRTAVRWGASIRKNSPEVVLAESPLGCLQVEEQGQDAIGLERQEAAALLGLQRDLDEWLRHARRLDLAASRRESLAAREQFRKEHTAQEVEHFGHMHEVRRRIQAIGRSSQPNGQI